MKKPKIIDHIALPTDVPCQYCKYRKELYKEPPKNCKECGFFNRREAPYTSQVPIYEEEDVCIPLKH